MTKRVTSLFLSSLLLGAPLAVAQDDALCLDYHLPEEDWVGMSAEEIFATARDTEIKRHADNQELSDEELKAMIASLLEK